MMGERQTDRWPTPAAPGLTTDPLWQRCNLSWDATTRRDLQQPSNAPPLALSPGRSGSQIRASAQMGEHGFSRCHLPPLKNSRQSCFGPPFWGRAPLSGPLSWDPPPAPNLTPLRRSFQHWTGAHHFMK